MTYTLCSIVIPYAPKPTASLQQAVEEAAGLTSCTTCRTASPQQIRSKLHATISKSYSKSHNSLYDRSTANRSNGVPHLTAEERNGNIWEMCDLSPV